MKTEVNMMEELKKFILSEIDKCEREAEKEHMQIIMKFQIAAFKAVLMRVETLEAGSAVQTRLRNKETLKRT